MTAFTNSFGQTINPGDEVLVIAQGYNHSIRERQGTYVGLSSSGTPQVRVKYEKRCWQRADGTIGRWESGAEYLRIPAETVRTYYSGRIYKLA